MKLGDIVLVPFPFSELNNVKVRPAVVIGITKDKHKDVILCAITSVIPADISTNEFIVAADNNTNLRKNSLVKVDRISTIKQLLIITKLGNLSNKDLKIFRKKFVNLVK